MVERAGGMGREAERQMRELSGLDARVRSLEREGRAWRRGCLLATVAVSAVALCAFRSAEGPIRARSPRGRTSL